MKKEMLYLKDSAAKMGIELSDLQLEQFDTYYEMLVEKNKVMNLTAITELEEVVPVSYTHLTLPTICSV